MVQDGCSSSSHHICIVDSKKEKKGRRKKEPHPYPRRYTNLGLDLIGQNLIAREAGKFHL